MGHDEIGPGGSECLFIQETGQAKAEAQMISRATRFSLVQIPKSLLSAGKAGTASIDDFHGTFRSPPRVASANASTCIDAFASPRISCVIRNPKAEWIICHAPAV